MNANEISPKANSRLNRIKKVIWVIRILIGLAVIFVLVAILIYLLGLIGWIDILPGILPSPFSKYSSLHAIPTSIFVLGIFRAGLFFSGAWVLDKLLCTFTNGNFFTAQNIVCIKWLGCLVAGDWLVVKFLDAFGSRAIMIGVGDFTKLAFGLLIILIAWIMDEGRKIQEEQELTV